MTAVPTEAPAQWLRLVRRVTYRRALLTLLALALFAFALPFGTVSCGTPVSFTGLELASANVPAESAAERNFAAEVHDYGTPWAAAALVATLVALALAAAGSARAPAAAITALVFLLLLPYVAMNKWAGFEVHEGWVLAVAAHTTVWCLALVRAYLGRRRRGATSWRTLPGGVLVVAVLTYAGLLVVVFGELS